MVKDSGEKKHKHTKNSLVSSTDEEFDKLIGETVQPGSDVLGGFEREYNEDTETEKAHLSDKDNTMERRSDQIVNILNNSVDSFEENQEFELSEHSYEGENADSRNDDFDEYYQNFLNTRDRNYRNNNIGFPRGRFGGKAVFSSAKKRSLVKIAVIFSTIVFLICGFRAIFGGTDTKAESMKVTEASNGGAKQDISNAKDLVEQGKNRGLKIILDGDNVNPVIKYDASKKNITLEALRTGAFVARGEKYQWIAHPMDKKRDGLYLKFEEQKGGLYVYSLDNQYSKEMVSIEELQIAARNIGLPKLKIMKFIPSADWEYLLIKTSEKKVFRHSKASEYYVYSIADKVLKKLHTEENDKTQLVVWSPVGHKVAYVVENDIYVNDMNQKRRVSSGGESNGNIINGIMDWVYEEEVFEDSQATWWSPDGKMIAYLQFNSTLVPRIEMEMYGLYDEASGRDADNSYTQKMKIAYPKAGHNNPVVNLHVYSMEKETAYNVDLGIKDEHLISHVSWITQKHGRLLVGVSDRIQTVIKDVVVEIGDGDGKIASRVVYEMKNEDNKWVAFYKQVVYVPKVEKDNGRKRDSDEKEKEKEKGKEKEEEGKDEEEEEEEEGGYYMHVLNNLEYIHVGVFEIPKRLGRQKQEQGQEKRGMNTTLIAPKQITKGDFDVIDDTISYNKETGEMHFVGSGSNKRSYRQEIYRIKVGDEQFGGNGNLNGDRDEGEGQMSIVEFLGPMMNGQKEIEKEKGKEKEEEKEEGWGVRVMPFLDKSGKEKGQSEKDKKGSYSFSMSECKGYIKVDYLGPNIPWQAIYKIRDEKVGGGGRKVIEIEGKSKEKYELVRKVETNEQLYGVIEEYNMPGIGYFQMDIGEGVIVDVNVMYPPGFNYNEEGKNKNKNKSKSKRQKMLVNIYGGPTSKFVTERYDMNGLNSVLSSEEEGVIVVKIDPRGTAHKGRKMTHVEYLELGKTASGDILEAIQRMPFYKKEKGGGGERGEREKGNEEEEEMEVSIMGWSYGGFLTLKVLEEQDNRMREIQEGKKENKKGENNNNNNGNKRMSRKISRGISIAPVTNWKFYDSVYTERYMRLPKDQDNLKGYEKSMIGSKMFVNGGGGGGGGGLSKVMMVHGSGDDNVNIQNTYWMMDRIEQVQSKTEQGGEKAEGEGQGGGGGGGGKGKKEKVNVELVVFPNSDHSIMYRKDTRYFLYEKIIKFLQ